MDIPHDTAEDTVIVPQEKDEEGLSVPGSSEPAGKE
jgi:hypothetical protein